MARLEDREDAVKALHRMIVYARNEAARLQVDDVVLLLGYAEDAVLTSEPWQGDDTPRDDAHRLSFVQH